MDNVISRTQIIRALVINSEIPWAYFDGASQGEPPLGGAGAVVYFSTKKKMLAKYATGQATNNMSEISALWETLKVVSSNQIQDIQIFGDSKVVVDWVNGKTPFELYIYNTFLLKFRI